MFTMSRSAPPPLLLGFVGFADPGPAYVPLVVSSQALQAPGDVDQNNINEDAESEDSVTQEEVESSDAGSGTSGRRPIYDPKWRYKLANMYQGYNLPPATLVTPPYHT
jgi:hypothetical protein